MSNILNKIKPFTNVEIAAAVVAPIPVALYKVAEAYLSETTSDDKPAPRPKTPPSGKHDDKVAA